MVTELLLGLSVLANLVLLFLVQRFKGASAQVSEEEKKLRRELEKANKNLENVKAQNKAQSEQNVVEREKANKDLNERIASAVQKGSVPFISAYLLSPATRCHFVRAV